VTIIVTPGNVTNVRDATATGAPTGTTMSMDTTVNARNMATGVTGAETIVNVKNTMAAGAHTAGAMSMEATVGEYGSSGGGDEGTSHRRRDRF